MGINLYFLLHWFVDMIPTILLTLNMDFFAAGIGMLVGVLTFVMLKINI